MRRTRAPQSAVRVSLFPFLAVLICTMGALILVLVVIARQARLDAVEASSDSAEPEAEDAQIDRELLELRIAQLEEQRRQTESDLEKQRLEVGHIEDHARRLKEELRELEAAHRALDKTEDTKQDESEELKRRITETNELIAEVEKQLEQSRRLAAQQRRAYAVVPYKGRFHTARRPIYIECRADKVILQPEGVELTDADFDGPIDSVNPLAAAVRAAREYHARVDGPDSAVAGEEPYPLLLVRPDGVLAYYVARSALRSWASDFGYELIDQDWELEFPAPDMTLAQLEREAIADARLRQRQLARIAPGRYGEARPTYRVGPDGGVVRVDSGRGGGQGTRRQGSFRPQREGSAFGNRAPGGSADTENRNGGGNATDPDELTAVYGDLDVGRQEGSNRQQAGGTPGGGLVEADEAHPGGGPGGESDQFAEGSDQPGRGAQNAERAPSGARPPQGTLSTATNSRQGGTSAQSSAQSSAGGSAASAQTTMSQDQPQDQSFSAAVENLARVRGSNWGLPDSTRGAVPITRPIRMQCFADCLVIWTDDNPPRPRKTVPFEGRTEDAVDELVSGVWDHMQTWGIAGNGLYWRPILNIEVPPEGERRYGELSVLLDGSGFDVRKKPVASPVAQRRSPLEMHQ